MPDLCVSFTGYIKGQHAFGWVVMNRDQPIATPDDVIALISHLEKSRGYDEGSVVILSFQRLEKAEGVLA